MSLIYERPILVPFHLDKNQVGRGKCQNGSGDLGNCGTGMNPGGNCAPVGQNPGVIKNNCNPGPIASRKCNAGGIIG